MNAPINRFNPERLITFCDAVVAIALTLLVLDLDIGTIKTDGVLTWDALNPLWPNLLSYLVSFVVIGVVWSINNQFFGLIKHIDTRLFWTNMVWLLFISLLPFSTRLVSTYFGQVVSTVVYSGNALGIALCLNAVWDYVEKRPELLYKQASPSTIIRFRIACNVGVINAAIAGLIAFVFPVLSFLIILSRPLTSALVELFYKERLRPDRNAG